MLVPSQRSFSSKPTFVSSQPTFVSSQPKFVSSQPTFVSSQPIFVSSQPTFVSSQPTFVSFQPTFVSSQPTFASWGGRRREDVIERWRNCSLFSHLQPHCGCRDSYHFPGVASNAVVSPGAFTANCDMPATASAAITPDDYDEPTTPPAVSPTPNSHYSSRLAS